MAGVSRKEREQREQREELLAQGLKKCTKCTQDLPLERFRVRADGYAGRRSSCIECQLAAEAAYRESHRDEDRQSSSRWREQNPEYARDRSAWYRTNEPLRKRLHHGAVRARKAGVRTDRITPDELLADWERRGIDASRDAYTGQPLETGWHLDHAVPLSTPDTPGHVVTNLVPCNKSINTSKSNKHWVSYLADRAEKEQEVAA